MIYRKNYPFHCPGHIWQRGCQGSIALQLFGGIAKEMLTGATSEAISMCSLSGIRVLQKQLLRYVVKTFTRAIYTSGQSSTSAGLTATAVKMNSGRARTLEAGRSCPRRYGSLCGKMKWIKCKKKTVLPCTKRWNSNP